MEFNGGYFMKLHEDKTIFSRSNCLPDHYQKIFKWRNPDYLILSTFEKLFHGIVENSHLQRWMFSYILPLIFSITQVLPRVDLWYLWADTSFLTSTTLLVLIRSQRVSRSHPRTTEFLLPCLRPQPHLVGSTTLQWHSGIFSMEKCPPLVTRLRALAINYSDSMNRQNLLRDSSCHLMTDFSGGWVTHWRCLSLPQST